MKKYTTPITKKKQFTRHAPQIDALQTKHYYDQYLPTEHPYGI